METQPTINPDLNRWQKVLIWGKTYPELSTRHQETVCTGGCLEDGTPIRLYPVPLRLLPGHSQYRLWDWVELPLGPSRKDNRPESRRVRPGEIRPAGHVDPVAGWELRREIIFRKTTWHYSCVRHLWGAQESDGTSLGLVSLSEVIAVEVEDRSDAERTAHERKLRELQSQHDFFRGPQPDLDFIPYKIRVRWKCEDYLDCPGHTSIVLDWGLAELGRKLEKEGEDGKEGARSKMEEISNLSTHDLRFFMGNFFLHQKTFGIVGLWYPKKNHMRQFQPQGDLFTPL